MQNIVMNRQNQEYVAARQFEAFVNDLLDFDIETVVALLDAYKDGCFLYQEAVDFYGGGKVEPSANGIFSEAALHLDEAA